MNTAAGTKESRRLHEQKSRKLKLVPRDDQPVRAKKLRIGVCDRLFSPESANSESLSPADDLLGSVDIQESRKTSYGSGMWLAVAAVSLILGFLLGNRRKYGLKLISLSFCCLVLIQYL